MSFGSRDAALVMAAWTSWAAASMFRSRGNRGVATEEAIVSGLAPGRFAVTRIVGKSTLGRSLTGRRWYARVPNSSRAPITRVVMMGRRMKMLGQLVDV